MVKSMVMVSLNGKMDTVFTKEDIQTVTFKERGDTSGVMVPLGRGVSQMISCMVWACDLGSLTPKKRPLNDGHSLTTIK